MVKLLNKDLTRVYGSRGSFLEVYPRKLGETVISEVKGKPK